MSLQGQLEVKDLKPLNRGDTLDISNPSFHQWQTVEQTKAIVKELRKQLKEAHSSAYFYAENGGASADPFVVRAATLECVLNLIEKGKYERS